MDRYALRQRAGLVPGGYGLSRRPGLGIGKYVVMGMAVMIFLVMALVLLISALIFLALACLVGIPLYIAGKRLMGRHGLSRPRLSPVERLKELYVEGKIDLLEFEHRVGKTMDDRR